MRISLFLSLCLLLSLPAAAQVQVGTAKSYPVFGEANRWNHYETKYTLVYSQDVEGALNDFQILIPSVQVTTNPQEVIGGKQSLKLSGDQPLVTIVPSAVNLEPGRTYVLQYDFRVLQAASQIGAVRAVFYSPTPIEGKVVLDFGGPLNLPNSTRRGTDTQSMRIPEQHGITLGLLGLQATVVIDNIRVFRQDQVLSPATSRLWRSGFPRIFNYMLTDPTNISLLHNVSLPEIERNLAAVDLITGTNGDATLSTGAWMKRLRDINPSLRVIPYQQAFMTQYIDRPPVWGSAGLNALFNQTVRPEWFLFDTSGKPVFSPDFPQNIQMNHTPFAFKANGVDFNQHLVQFLQSGSLPSGLFEGFHFDQPEWYPNPLLADRNGRFPLMDTNLDGKADTQKELHDNWKSGFVNFFRLAREKFGPNRLMFGNAGYISQNPTMLGFLNGWLREIYNPYEVSTNGEWRTDDASYWYQTHQAYQASMRYAQAPSMTAFQYSGSGLGTPTGGITANGYPDRRPTLEPRDYRRMRFGLASTLLDDGFFEYDLVDNTTIPLWFDEYAVDGSGAASRDLRHKGYLGQPLADAVELRTAERLVAEVNFDSTTPTGITLGESFVSTNTPGLVLSGANSGIFSYTDLARVQYIAASNPAALPLEGGKTYEATMDYMVLDYRPSTYRGLLAFGIQVQGEALTQGRSNFQFLPDIDGPGQRGRLRVVTRVPQGQVGSLTAGFLDAGIVVVDNIRITEGGPGVWRRDFENGIVLVNPTPNAIQITQGQLVGPLNRSGVRRIRGTQSPAVNDGSAVTNGLQLGPGEGIILLANRVSPAPMVAPTSIVTERGNTSIQVFWRQVTPYVAGYVVRYGEDPVTPNQEVAVTRHKNFAQIDGLAPGTRYYLRVAAYDYLGNIGPFSTPFEATTSGNTVSRPEFALAAESSGVTQGALVSLVGIGLANTSLTAPTANNLPLQLGTTRVLVNGVAAPLLSVSPTRIVFQAPWELGGEHCLVHVVVNGVSSAERRMPLKPAAPELALDSTTVSARAFHADNNAPVTADDPALPGEEIWIEALGVGAVDRFPFNGQPANRFGVAKPLQPIEVSIGSIPVSLQEAVLSKTDVGVYRLKVTVPFVSDQPRVVIQLRVAGIPAMQESMDMLSVPLSFATAAHKTLPKY